MTRIDFYVLQTDDESERIQFATKLCEKAFKQGMRVMLLATDNEATQMISESLWHFRPESFLPHTAVELADAHTPIVIAAEEDSPQHHELLINLTNNLPAMFSRFERVAEIVTQARPTLDATRRNFAHYKSRGYPINKHDM